MRSLIHCMLILLLAVAITPAHGQAWRNEPTSVEYVSDTWGTKWGVDSEATNKKKAALVAANPDKKPTSMRKQYMTYTKIVLHARDLSIHVPMGPIGGFVRVKSDAKNLEKLSDKDHTCPDLTVVNLIKKAPGHKCGLKIGDVIYGVNGKSFTRMDWDVNAGRKGSFRDLGTAIEDSEANKNGLVELMVRRGTATTVIKVQLPQIGGLSKTYPFNCPKSMTYYDEICDHLASTQKSNGSFGTGIIGSSVAGLALLGHGGSKYRRNIESVVDYVGRTETMKAGCYAGFGTTWQIMYQGVFLAEYYLVTGNKRVLPVIQHLADVAGASMYNRMENKSGAYYGTFGHYINPDMDAQETVYKMSVITAGIAWSWALASQAGADVPIENWEAITYHINRATGNNGGMGYCGPGGGSGSHPGVSNSMLALSCAPKDRRHDGNLKKLRGFLANEDNFGSVMINHGVSVTPFYTTSLALYRTDKRAYRDFMDYWKWYITLTRGPDNYALYWDMSGGGGDCKLGVDTLMNAAIGIMMGAANGRLFMYNDGDKSKKATVAKRSKKPMPAVVRAKKPKANSIAAIDAKVLKKLAALTETGTLPRMPIRISKTRATVALVKASKDGTLTFSAGGKEADFKFTELTLRDRATITLALAKAEPEKKALRGIVGFYMECAGSASRAQKYYDQAGPDIAAKLRALFE